jgi:histidyl-tRNA synthetase
MKKINNPKGTRDFSGDLARTRIKLIRKFEDVFESLGYEPLITPTIEYTDLLYVDKENSYGEDSLKLLYKFKDLGNREIFLKYDQTVPLARFVSQNPALLFPYKRYAVDRAYRYENVQKGRYREFWQCDIDVVGTDNIQADVFVIYSAILVIKKINKMFNNVIMQINDRRILYDVFSYLKIDSKKQPTIIRTLDKIDKQGLEKTKEDLQKMLTKEQLDFLVNNLNKKQEPKQKLKDIQKYITKETYTSVYELIDSLDKLGIYKNIEINFFLARGLDYYTSTIFELIVPSKDVKSIGGGGRYNNLIKKYCGRDVPAVGFAFGFERIVDLLENKINNNLKQKSIFIASPQKESKTIIEIVKKLASQDIYCAYDFGNKNLVKQIQYAQKTNYRFVLICDLYDLKKNNYKLKDLQENTEQELSLEEIINIIKKK